ncbi:sugar ABC transporter ATP-binding protein [Treponema sp. OMZ 840]|uniref:sugar ABC transporter ATP-binding protein n=1 Tax=Treponema sp. OMZ 840 TaxID=244313 RepID=UPI003D89F367
MDEIILQLKEIDKTFGGIHAVNSVNFTLRKGEIHALLGENGAGKSTLVKILTGVIQADNGKILLDNEEVIIESPIGARRKGIGVIYQELSLIDSLTVGENIFLGHEPQKRFGLYDYKSMYEKSESFLRQFDIAIDVHKLISDLRPGEKRIIEIIKALALNARILLLDEPTTGMSQKEINALFKIMHTLTEKNVSMIYISHYLDEIFRICDRATVLRDGQVINTYQVKDITSETLIKAMIGHTVQKKAKNKQVLIDEEVIKLDNFKTDLMQKPISLTVHKGEIVGVTGIIGSGKSELANSIFGIGKILQGKVFLHHKEIRIGSPLAARRQGIALIPEDRKTQGLFLKDTIIDNLMIVNIAAEENKYGLINRKRAVKVAREIGSAVKIHPLIPDMIVGNLSGGNQQKVVIGKWLSMDPDLIIMDEPTRGIDVGAKNEIYNQIYSFANAGKGLLVFSSEYQELINLCDRILVIRQGEIVGDFFNTNIAGEKILSLSLGGE